MHKMMFAYNVALKVHEEEARGMLKMLVQLYNFQLPNCQQDSSCILYPSLNLDTLSLTHCSGPSGTSWSTSPEV